MQNSYSNTFQNIYLEYLIEFNVHNVIFQIKYTVLLLLFKLYFHDNVMDNSI